MYCILVVGMTGQGKSRFVKQFIEGRNCHVFDVQNEYNLPRAGNRTASIHMNEKKFIQECAKRKNTICVFEEATGFFEGKTAPELRRLVLSKRHTGNVLVFCFHSISSIPPRLMQFTNFVVLFKTMDEPYQVERKFPRLYPYYTKLLSMPDKSYFNIKTIPQ